ncbi:hypothetical protein [Jatrophihabitans fulvus]
MIRTVALLSAGMLAGGLVTATAAGAAPAPWSPDTRLGSLAAGAAADATLVRTNASGAAVATWQTTRSSVLQPALAVRDAGGAWSAARFPVTDGGAGRAWVGIDRTGRAVAVYTDSAPGRAAVVRSIQRPAGGTWSKPVTVPVRASDTPSDFEVAGTGLGALAITRAHTAYVLRLQGTTWRAPVQVSATAPGGGRTYVGADHVQVSVRDSNRLTATWTWRSANQGGRPCRTEQRGGLDANGRALARASFAPTECGTGVLAVPTETSAGGTGTVHAWVHPTNSAGRSYASVAYLTPDGVCHRHDLSSGGGLTTAVSVAMYGGTATAVWTSDTGPSADDHRLLSSTLRGTTWSAPSALVNTRDRYFSPVAPRVALAQAQRVVSWSVISYATDAREDVLRTEVGTQVATATDVATVALDATGPRVAALTRRGDTGARTISARTR